MKPLLYREVVRKLEAAGFAQLSRKGSHVKFARQTGHQLRTVIVPCHREVSPGALRSMMRQAGLSPDEFDLL